jgi:hypothetical protein
VAGGVTIARGFLWTTIGALLFSGCSLMPMACALSRKGNSSKISNSSTDPEKPSILLRVMPQVAHAPAEVRITVLVKDPGGVLWCPSFQVEIEQEVSGREQACPPAAPHQEAYALRMKNHVFRRPGTHTVEVRVLVGGKVVMVESTRVLIVGPDEDANYSAASL